MKIKFLAFFALLAVFSMVVPGKILAVSYPVAELGNCKDQADCKIYCDNSKNSEACLAFAKKNNLMSDKEIQVAKKFTAGEINGPGGCKTKDACEEYCNDISRIDECIAFAEKNNLMPASELADAKKVQAALKRGIKSPSCGSKKSCDAYCENPDHMEECVNFALQAGFMQGKEAEDARKMLQAVKRGIKPPPCKGKEACDAYCQQPENMEACMTFAAEAGLMSEEEKANSQKMLQAIRKGVKPPPCKGKEECDAYCQTDEHIEECINFSVAAGMMDAKDAEMAKKTKGRGPGGCKSQEECKAFCDNPANQETCFNFAKENGMLPQEDMQRMQQNSQQIQQTLQNASPEVLDCLVSAIGSDAVEKLKQGQPFGSKEQGQKMQPCFDRMKQFPKQGMQEQTGPGGCRNPEECQAYCETHKEECQQFNGPKSDNGHRPDERAGQPAQGPGPGGCKSQEECEAYCSTHRQECGAPPPMEPDQNPNQNPNWQPGQPPEGGQQPQNMMPPQQPTDQQQQQQPPPPPPPPPTEEAPSPLSSYINTDSLVGSLLDAGFKAIFLR